MPKATRLAKRTSVHLDLIRGVSAVAVLVYHLRGLFFVDYPFLADKSLLASALYAVTGYGHQAVIAYLSSEQAHEASAGFVPGPCSGSIMGPNWNENSTSGPSLLRCSVQV